MCFSELSFYARRTRKNNAIVFASGRDIKDQGDSSATSRLCRFHSPSLSKSMDSKLRSRMSPGFLLDNKNFMLFSKHVAALPIEELAERLPETGIYSLDLTVRRGGHIEPQNVSGQLPSLCELLHSKGIKIGMITTDIVSNETPFTEEILKTASECGIKYYKTGYYMYESFGTIRLLRKNIKDKLLRLSELNEKYDIHMGIHNHSDNFFGAVPYDIAEVLDGIPAKYAGCYFDPAHAVIEGGSCGWKMAMDILGEKITMLAVKDFRWVDGKHRYAGGRKHSVEFCPLSQGNVPWEEVIELLRKLNFAGPISFHSEYQGQHSFADLNDIEVLIQTKKDVKYFLSKVSEV